MPRRKGGLFLPLDVNFMRDPRIVRARRQNKDAPWLYLAMCLASKALGSDGRLEPVEVELLHMPGWRRLMPILLHEQLVHDFDDGFYTIGAWLRHNDPQAKLEQKRAVDRDYHAGRRRDRVGTESDPSRGAERSREEKREVATRTESVLDADCEHGVDRHVGCAQCRSQRVSA